MSDYRAVQEYFHMVKEFLDRPDSARGQLSPELIDRLGLRSSLQAEKKQFSTELEAKIRSSIKNYVLPDPSSIEMKGFAGRKCVFHPRHPLTISHTSQHYEFCEGSWNCDGRNFPEPFKCTHPRPTEKDASYNFHCKPCQFDLCGLCAVVSMYPPEDPQELQQFYMNVVETLLEKSDSASIRLAFSNGYQLLKSVPSSLSGASDDVVSKLSSAARYMTSADQLLQQALRTVQLASRDITAKCDKMETERIKKEREASEALRSSERAIISVLVDTKALRELDQALAEDREKLRRLEGERSRETSGVFGVFNLLGHKVAEAARVRGSLPEKISSMKFSIQCLERERAMFKPYASQATPVAYAAKEREVKAKLDARHAIAARQRMELFIKFCSALHEQLAKDCRLMTQLANAVVDAKKAGQSGISLRTSLDPLLQRLAGVAGASSGLLLTETDARSLSTIAAQLQKQLQDAVRAVQTEATQLAFEIF